MQSDLCTYGVQITKIHFYVCNDVIIFVSDETCAKNALDNHTMSQNIFWKFGKLMDS